MPYRPKDRDHWMVSLGYRGQRLRLSAGTPIEATAERYEVALRTLARHHHDEVLGALTAKRVTVPQVARWVETVGEQGVIGEFRSWERRQAEDRLLRPEVDRWLAERRALGRPRASTLERYATCLYRAIPARMLARELDREAVVKALGGRNARKTYVALTLWTRWARGQGILERDPMLGVPVPAAGKPRDRWLSQERLVALLRAASPRYRDALLLAYGTGIERGVLVALRPGDVNVAEHTILARGTKTHNRERVVLVADFAWPAVERLLAESRRRDTLLPPMTGWALSKAHRQAARAIGEPGLRLHDARRTYGVRMVKQGCPVQVVADQLGNTPEMVVRAYSKFLPSMAERRHWEAKASANGW